MTANKTRGEEVEKFIIKRFGLKDSLEHGYDAVDTDGHQIEIKSTELFHRRNIGSGFTKNRYGRFSIIPEAHRKLDKSSRYYFLINLFGKPLFCIEMDWEDVNKILKKYTNKTKRYKLHISEIIKTGNVKKMTFFGETMK